MPVIRDSAPIFHPNEDQPIVKYMDISKLLSLLQRKKLFFCRLDKLEDQFEGTTPITNFSSRVKWYQHEREIGYFENNLSNERIAQLVDEQYINEQFRRQFYCVNCWNKGGQESAALWKIYSDFGKGIMIKSSVQKLTDSLNCSSEKLYLSEVHYLDYEKDYMLDGNAFFSIIHKHNAYSYEDEIRLIHDLFSLEETIDWTKSEIENGLFISVDLDQMIEEIVVGPYAPIWFVSLIEDLISEYGLIKPVNMSKLKVRS